MRRGPVEALGGEAEQVGHATLPTMAKGWCETEGSAKDASSLLLLNLLGSGNLGFRGKDLGFGAQGLRVGVSSFGILV